MKIPMLWVFLCVAFSSQVWAYPTSQPAEPKSASQPAKTATQSAVLLRMDEQGLLWSKHQFLSVPALVAKMGTWKQQATPVQLLISAKAPMSRILVIQTLLREFQISFHMTREGSAVSGTIPHSDISTKTPGTSPHGTLPSQSSGVVTLRPWAKVPMKMQRGVEAQTSDAVELRGLLWSNGRAFTQTVPTALVRYVGKQRQALGHVQTMRTGQFRYRWKPQAGAVYRVSVVSGPRIMEFPIPLDRQQQGYLYLRVTLAEQAKTSGVAKTVASGHTSSTTSPTQDRGTSGVVHPHARMQTPSTRPIQATGDKAQGPCVWDRVPLGKMEKVAAKDGVEIRVRFLFPATMKQEPLATGLIQKKGKERTPVARVRTDKFGCARYWVKAEPGALYEAALLLGAKLSVLPLPQVRAGMGSVVATLPIRAQQAQSTVMENLSVIYELASADRIRAVHVVQLFYQPTPVHKKDDVILPLAAGAEKIKLEQGIPGATWKAEKIGLRLTNTPKAGSYRLLYYYELPREQGATSWHMVSAQPIGQVNLFFAKGLKPGLQAKLQPVQLGQGTDKREFQVLRLPGMGKGQSLQVPVLGTEPLQRGVLAWIRHMKNEPNGKNKLVGLAVLLSISLLGLFWVFSTPRTRQTKPA